MRDDVKCTYVLDYTTGKFVPKSKLLKDKPGKKKKQQR